MISLICRLLLKLGEKLPESPFGAMSTGVEVLSDIMGYINWFIPFKPCFAMMTAWCSCMAIYYVWKQGRAIVNKII